MKLYIIAIFLFHQWHCLGFVQNRKAGIAACISYLTKASRLSCSAESLKVLESFNNECKKDYRFEMVIVIFVFILFVSYPDLDRMKFGRKEGKSPMKVELERSQVLKSEGIIFKTFNSLMTMKMAIARCTLFNFFI